MGVAIMQFAGSDSSDVNTLDEDLEERVVKEINHLAGPIGTGTPQQGPIPIEQMGNTWLLGDSFLRQFYSVYDYDNERFGVCDLKK